MKSFVAIIALVAVAAADVSHLRQAQAYQSGSDRTAEVLRSDSDVRPDGYSFSYETSNGISGQATAQLKQLGEEAALQVQGSNQHTAPDGIAYAIQYVADENGYQPQGAHLPTPPPTQAIPDYILRSIEYNAQQEAREAKNPAQFNRFQ